MLTPGISFVNFKKKNKSLKLRVEKFTSYNDKTRYLTH